jgi:nitrate reductase assembly molybdenum cofactor insertion protein NarJ
MKAGFDEQTRTLLQDAAEWRLLARLFECPSPEWHDDVDALARELHAEPLRDVARKARAQGTEGAYHSIFGPGGPAPPREASYHRSIELGSLLSEVVGQYEAFGYHPETNEPPDHIAVEAGFVAYLRLKEAYVRASGDAAAALAIREAAARFAADHVGVVAHPLAASLAESDIGYLADAAALLAARIEATPVATLLPVVQPSPFGDEDEGQFACDI